MGKYVCVICGYIYDEAAGDPENGVNSGTLWADVPEYWTCPICGTGKVDFQEEKSSSTPPGKVAKVVEGLPGGVRDLSVGELSALFSNLSKGCEKQYRVEEAGLFQELAAYYQQHNVTDKEGSLKDLVELNKADIDMNFVRGKTVAEENHDRGGLRAMVWGDKVSRMLSGHLSKYAAQGTNPLENTRAFVCEICGFIFVGDELPEVCPVCKVPNYKMTEIKRG